MLVPRYIAPRYSSAAAPQPRHSTAAAAAAAPTLLLYGKLARESSKLRHPDWNTGILSHFLSGASLTAAAQRLGLAAAAGGYR